MKIAIITGGESAEREVSIRSAENIFKLIDFAQTQIFIFPEEKINFLESVHQFDLVIPMIHGVGGEDGTLQELLESLHIPYLFSGIETHRIGIDKKKTKELVATLGITAPTERELFPVFVKPRFGGSSVATQLCANSEELDTLKKIYTDTDFLMEEPIKGREFTVGVIQYEKKVEALPVAEIIPKGNFFDFENKYNPEKLAQEICPAHISEDLSSALQKCAVDVHNFLGVKHISRSDFMVTNDNKIYFLEINTIPGMTETSLIPKMVAQKGISVTELLKSWCFGR